MRAGPVIIAGMHRSGTSMVAQLLSRAGLFLGNESQLMGKSPYDNPDGYWELTENTNFSDRLLEKLGGSWANPPSSLHSDEWRSEIEFTKEREQASQVLAPLLESESRWGWKDPRNSILLPFWKEVFPKGKVVVCLRNPLDVAFSLSKRVSLRLDFTKALELWRTYYEILDSHLHGMPYLVTHYESYFYAPEEEIRRLTEFVGLPLDEQDARQVKESIKVGLYRAVTTEQMLQDWEHLPLGLLDLYKKFSAQAGNVYARLLSDQAYQNEHREQALYHVIDTATDAFEHFASDNEQLRRWLVEANNKATYLGEELTQTQDKLAQARSEIASQREALARYQPITAQLESALSEAAHLRNEITAMRSTTGWKVLEMWWGVKSRLFGIFRRGAEADSQSIRDRVKSVLFSDVDRALRTVDHIQMKMAPLYLTVDEKRERAVNIVIPTIDFRYFFGGYIGVFNLALALKRSGHTVRMVIVDECNYQPDKWREAIKAYQGLSDFFDHVTVSYHFNRSKPLTVSPDDRFVSISAWTSYVAHYASQELGQDRFIYMTQEYEPLFHDAGSIYNIVNQTYKLPHYGIYSTEFYRQYARQNNLGEFAGPHGDEHTVAIRNAVARSPVTRERLQGRENYKLLLYARPEAHAHRNMFEMAILALRQAIQSGVFDLDKWTFYGIGTTEYGGQMLPLTANVNLQLLERVSLNEYLELLPDYDVGLSLMSSPHPSLPPLDMAAAGLLTVTNTFANKTAEKLSAISPNLIPVSPTVQSIKMGLDQAVSRVADIDARLRGTDLNWPRDWDETFDDEVLDKISKFINAEIP